MTAQEAASASWNSLKQYRWAALYLAVGAALGFVGLSYDDLDKLQAAGAGSAALGVLQWIVDRSSKRTGDEVADKVADRIWEQLGSVQQVANQTSTAVMQLSNGLAESERTRDEMHQQNQGRVDAIDQRLADHAGAIDHLGEAVKSLKPDFEKRELRK